MFENGEVLPGSRMLQVEAHGGFQMQFSLLRIAEMGLNDAEVILNLRGVWIGEFLEGGLGFQPVAALEVGAAELPVDAGWTVGSLRELPEQGQRLRRLVGFEIRRGEVVPGGGVAGIELQRFLKRDDGRVNVAGLQATRAEEIPRLRGGNAGFQRLLETAGRAGKVVVFEIGHAGLEIFRGRPAAGRRAGNDRDNQKSSHVRT